MKKILVVLLVLAVAGGVFAQGSWSVGGAVEIGTRLNFDTVKRAGDRANVFTGNSGADNITIYNPATHGANEPDKARVSGTAWNHHDAVMGKFSLTYRNNGFTGGANLNTRGTAEAEYYFTYVGENFRAQAMVANTNLLFGQSGGDHVKRLWGEYQVLNGLIDIHVAYKGPGGAHYWISDLSAASNSLTAGQFGDGGWRSRIGGKDPSDAVEQFDHTRMHHDFFAQRDQGKTFTFSDGATFLVTQVNLDNLQLGILLPYLFADGRSETGTLGYNPSTLYRNGVPPNEPARVLEGGLVEGALKETVFGAKFNMSPIEFATQLKVRDYGVYFGGKFFAGPITAGLSFSGLLNPEVNTNKFTKFGGDVDYNAGAFGGGIMASMERHVLARDGDSYVQLIRIEPRFFYNAIPSHLHFALNTGFYFLNAQARRTPGNRDTPIDKSSDMTWAVQPAVYWNFLGTGAPNSYYAFNTGMMVRYRVASASAKKSNNVPIWNAAGDTSGLIANWWPTNTLDVVFRWGF